MPKRPLKGYYQQHETEFEGGVSREEAAVGPGCGCGWGCGASRLVPLPSLNLLATILSALRHYARRLHRVLKRELLFSAGADRLFPEGPGLGTWTRQTCDL